MSETSLKSGLYVISVPIGNLQDITIRAINTLRELDKIYCEDTRITKKLLNLYDIPCPELIRCDDAVQHKMISSIKADLENNLAIGLVSDAGTPLISDPGYTIISALRAENFAIYPITGPCAAIAALSVSGLPTTSFRFMGFIPKKQKQRLEVIDLIQHNKDSFVFYERPERLLDFIQLFPDDLQSAKCFVAREMTKLHEEYISASAKELQNILPNISLKGEAVLVISTHELDHKPKIDLEAEICELLSQGQSPKDISKNISLKEYASRNELYALAQALKDA